ncbi:MAG: hypothetical protein A3J69_00925 [Candidatus Levybacteria bacterium RIFCSPHIGHO2_02_FULL_42_12]|nr:MAG: hypothetical protein A3J69_00925 [Candidatus Levybacteria bacterium RIFCSPHIGHO2_02_FULL_42_12]
MKQHMMKQLIAISYKNNKLDEKVVFKIACLLLRKDLKRYVRALKNYEKKRTVTVSLPSISRELIHKNEYLLKKIFPKKEILYKKDPLLMAGVRFSHHDTIFEMSLRNTLEQIAAHAGETDR